MRTSQTQTRTPDNQPARINRPVCQCCADFPQAHNSYPCVVCGHVTQTPGQQAQAQFEALFPAGYRPLTDTRTPADIKAGVTLAQAQARNQS